LNSNPRSDADKPARLHVYIARTGAASRRAAERFIAEGRVSVNGEVVTQMGTSVAPGDRVELDGRLIQPENRLLYILLNKPTGYISSSSDPEGRQLALDLVQGEFRERLYGVGRLDQYSSGLLIFTNDGDFARALSHPSSGIEKEYRVMAFDPVPPGFLASFERGIDVEGTIYRAFRASPRGENGADIVLVEGKNREIRKVFGSAGIRVKSLERVRIGNLMIDGLETGSYRLLGEKEVEGLRAIASSVEKGRGTP
jgi:23S rRNA pseudouridine2605 synthase